jgi:hypothetical protein
LASTRVFVENKPKSVKEETNEKFVKKIYTSLLINSGLLSVELLSNFQLSISYKLALAKNDYFFWHFLV